MWNNDRNILKNFTKRRSFNSNFVRLIFFFGFKSLVIFEKLKFARHCLSNWFTLKNDDQRMFHVKHGRNDFIKLFLKDTKMERETLEECSM